MPKQTISTRTYVVICVLLVLLTILTVAFSFVPASHLMHVIVGLGIAVCKAALVVLFFMHVLISSRLTWIVLTVACFWLGILVELTFSDYLTREMISGMFGH